MSKFTEWLYNNLYKIFNGKEKSIDLESRFNSIKFIDHVDSNDWQSIELKPVVEYAPKENDISIGKIIFNYNDNLDIFNDRLIYKFKAFKKDIDGLEVYRYEFREVDKQNKKEVLANE
jgi:hypothetical protein